MKKLTVAVCEESEIYRERLAEFVIRKKGERMQIAVFSSMKIFLEREETPAFDVILWGKGFEKICEKEKHGNSLLIYLSDRPDGDGQERFIFKFQSAEEIVRNIFSYYLELEQRDYSVSRRKKEIIGVYSPSHSRMQTPFAMTLAQLLGEEKRVLYVNLGEWAGFGPWMREKYERDLADLLYLISCHGSHTVGILDSIVHTTDKIDYIPPMADAQLLSQTGEADYQELLKFLTERSDYEAIVLDFGIMVPGFFSLLEQCSDIYSVSDKNMWARWQMQQFEESLMKDKRHLAEKIQDVAFSLEEMGTMEGEPVIHQWVYGVVGDRARAARYMAHGTN